MRACEIEIHINISEEALHKEIYRKNAADQNRDPHFVRACGVETHVKISQEPLYTETYRKNAAAQSEHPDQAPAFTPTVRTPQFGHTVSLGKNVYSIRFMELDFWPWQSNEEAVSSH